MEGYVLAPIAVTTIVRTHLFVDFHIRLRTTKSRTISRQATSAISRQIAAVSVAISDRIANSDASAAATANR